MADVESNSSLDPQLIALLDELRNTPERDLKVVSANRARFESELDAYLNSNYATPGQNILTQGKNSQRIKEFLQMMTIKHRVGLTVIAIILAIAVVIFAGTSATVSAAQGALPGDALYSVKTGWEQTQARFESDSFDQAIMYLEFAERRLDEIESLIAEGRYLDIAKAVDEFEFYLQQAIQSLGKLAGSEPERATQLTIQISNALSRYAQILTGMLARVPESVQDDLQRALTTSDEVFTQGEREEFEFNGVVESIAEESWSISEVVVNIAPWTDIKGSPVVGDQVKVHAYIEKDGSLTASEIELLMMDEEGEDANDNSDYDHGNSNINDNGDDGSVNSNDNDNENDNDGNSNINDNGDDGNVNSNDNDDDDSDEDSNSNDNDEDGDGNSNSNDNDDDDSDEDSNSNGNGDEDEDSNSDSDDNSNESGD